MDSDLVSAIDDGGGSIIFSGGRPQRTVTTGQARIPQDPGFNTAHYDHWTNANSAFASGVDDGCPTELHHSPPSRRTLSATGPGPRDKPRLGSDVVEKLRKNAVAKENQRLRAERDQALATQRLNPDPAPVRAETSPTTKPKGFFIPKGLGKGIKIVGRDGKNDVVKEPAVKPQNFKADAKAAVTDFPLQEPAPAISRPRSVDTQANASRARGVCIVGKNGEQAFVHLPMMRANSRVASHVYVPAINRADEPTQQVAQEKKAQQDRKAAKAAEELRVQRLNQEKRDAEQQKQRIRKVEAEKRAQSAKTAPVPLMSGALPASAKNFLPPKPVSVHSVSSESAILLNGMFGGSSKARSRASSKTVTPPAPQGASLKAVSRAASHRSRSVSIAGWESAGSGRAGNAGAGLTTLRQSASNGKANINTATSPLWQELGGGLYEAAQAGGVASVKATSQHSSQRSKAPTNGNWQEGSKGASANPNPPSLDPWAAIEKGFSGASPAPQLSNSQRASGSLPGVQQKPSQAPRPSWLSAGVGHTGPPVQTPPMDRPSVPSQPPAVQRVKASTPPEFPLGITRSYLERKKSRVREWQNHTSSALLDAYPATINNPFPRAATFRHKDASQNTILASEGGMTTHPLSTAPSELARRREPIKVQGVDMTYDAYHAMRLPDQIGGERRNFSKTNSSKQSARGGDWGVAKPEDHHNNASGSKGVSSTSGSGAGAGGSGSQGPRNGDAAWTAGAGFGAGAGFRAGAGFGAGNGSGGNCQAPTVVSEHSNGAGIPVAYHESVQRSVSRASKTETMRSNRGQGAAPQSRAGSLPPVNPWNMRQVDGAAGSGSATSALGLPAYGRTTDRRTYRSPDIGESPVLRETRSDGESKVQLRMPWDKIAHSGSRSCS